MYLKVKLETDKNCLYYLLYIFELCLFCTFEFKYWPKLYTTLNIYIKKHH